MLKYITMEKKIIEREEKKIIQEINSVKWNGREINPISDGIISIDDYFNSEIKILWINKEVNSTEEDADWNLREALYELREDNRVSKGWANTFNPIIYIIYGIFNKKNWAEIPDTWVEPEIIEYLRKIAYINVKKIPGGSTANWNELVDFHNKFGYILEKQIKLYKPDVIICGYTYEIIKETLNQIYEKTSSQKFEIDDKNKDNIFYYNNEILIIDAYHPNSRKNKENYCNGIINGVLDWIERKKI